VCIYIPKKNEANVIQGREEVGMMRIERCGGKGDFEQKGRLAKVATVSRCL